MVAGSAKRLREAEEIVDELRKALAVMGVTLPSLRVDPVSLATDARHPLIDLGRCNLDTAARLAAALRHGHG
ncbi:hypothetical protein [Streptomyces yaizuensis]|uniref:Secreted protein n=1 Tax=Streptomyces yaizuensis TaxID=2989713 RepID=A0ABQ5P3S9_9ACTN|nr:hypothetical protein [Streptomyces sp. YSPA8]GLF97145.1 hypothetical protein SYYSPA8_22630 [Streptomyces sp. YSPA8]